MIKQPYKTYIMVFTPLLLLLTFYGSFAFADTITITDIRGTDLNIDTSPKVTRLVNYQYNVSDTIQAFCTDYVNINFNVDNTQPITASNYLMASAQYVYYLYIDSPPSAYPNSWQTIIGAENYAQPITEVTCDYTILPPAPVIELGDSIVFSTNEEVQKFYTWIWWYIFVFALAVGIPVRFIMKSTNKISSW